MNILVTGGAGFIGSHIVESYISKGYRVIVLDNLSSGKKSNIHPDAKFYEMDLMDPEVETIFKNEKIDKINHHAAQISVTQSVSDPSFDAEINILGSLKILKLANEYKVKKFVFASTGGAIYGEQEYFPACEKHPCRPLSPYGIAKFSVENYMRFYNQTYNLNTAVLRYSNVYGPRQDPHGEAGVVAIFCQKLIGNQIPIIYGDGEQTRDFVSVFDVVQANNVALSEDCQGVFNVGTAQETTVNSLSKYLTKISGKNIEASHESPRKGEQRRSVIDFRKLNSSFGWKPTYSLEKGLTKTYNFFQGA